MVYGTAVLSEGAAEAADKLISPPFRARQGLFSRAEGSAMYG